MQVTHCPLRIIFKVEFVTIHDVCRCWLCAGVGANTIRLACQWVSCRPGTTDTCLARWACRARHNPESLLLRMGEACPGYRPQKPRDRGRALDHANVMGTDGFAGHLLLLTPSALG